MDSFWIFDWLSLFSVNNIPGIEEVNMIKDDGSVIHFNNPKVNKLESFSQEHFILMFLIPGTSFTGRQHFCCHRTRREQT